MKKVYCMLMPLVLLYCGCVQPTKRGEEISVKPNTAGQPTLQGPLLPTDVIDKKIEYLGRILENSKLNEDEKKLAQNLQTAYKTIRIINQDASITHDAVKQMTLLLLGQLNQLDEKYFLRKQPDAKYYSEAVSVLAIKRKKIQDSYLTRDYQSVITQCVELETTFGPDALTPDIGLFFAVALSEKGVLKEAVKIAQKIVRELEGKPDLLDLRVKVLEWQIAQGNKDQAQQMYEKTVDAFDEKQLLLKRARQLITGEQPAKLVKVEKSSSGTPAAGTENKPKERNLATVLKEVDELVKKNEFTKAKLLLSQQSIQSSGGQEAETLEQALKTVSSAEEKFQQDENARNIQKNEALATAKKLIKDEKYEEALQQLDKIESNRNSDSESKELKELAESKYINFERNKAAKLFLTAKNTADLSKKKELLLSSYQKLKALITKYPQSGFIGKLTDNIQTVKEELQRLGVNPD